MLSPVKRVANNRKTNCFIAEICYTVVYTRAAIHFCRGTCNSTIVTCYVCFVKAHAPLNRPSVKTLCYCNAQFTPPTRIKQNCLVLFCRCQRCELNWWQVKTVFSSPQYILRLKSFVESRISRQDETAEKTMHVQFRKFLFATVLSWLVQLVVWHRGRTLVFGRRTSLSCARPAADG